MAEARSRATTIDEYIAGFPDKVQDKLEALRRTIKKAVPDATEAIQYGIPAFELRGNIVHFGAFGDHIDLYPVPSNAEALTRELAGFRQGKGSARFPLDGPLPLKLIARIAEFRAAENLNKAFSRQKLGR
ncbi:MAG TPA: DUF1801 domain-containing protein [Trueperaceae bacterium]|nr:DUF1801 domain-containing protein [Trueperaceae bacterium]